MERYSGIEASRIDRESKRFFVKENPHADALEAISKSAFSLYGMLHQVSKEIKDREIGIDLRIAVKQLFQIYKTIQIAKNRIG